MHQVDDLAPLPLSLPPSRPSTWWQLRFGAQRLCVSTPKSSLPASRCSQPRPSWHLARAPRPRRSTLDGMRAMPGALRRWTSAWWPPPLPVLALWHSSSLLAPTTPSWPCSRVIQLKCNDTETAGADSLIVLSELENLGVTGTGTRRYMSMQAIRNSSFAIGWARRNLPKRN